MLAGRYVYFYVLSPLVFRVLGIDPVSHALRPLVPFVPFTLYP